MTSLAAGADADLVILGAGCAGLSLAARLARSQHRLSVHIIEPRTEYEDDRSWCFWRPERHDLSDLVSHSWDGWRFSGATGPAVHHRVEGLRYQYVRGSDFYTRARERIDASSDITLHSGVHATGLVSLGEGPGAIVRVETDRGSIRARHVVDTRPRVMPARLYQSFAGVEIESEHRLPFDPAEVGLMDAMATDAGGMHFRYTLPLGRTRALVEWTRFSATPVPSGILSAELDAELARLGLASARVIRREGGVLPMGTPGDLPDAPAGVVVAGNSGGALRAASGYGFLRIQKWAQACAYRMQRGEPPVGHPSEPWLRRSMDRIFLQAVRADLERTPDYFLALARGVPPAGLVRFLSDAALLPDYARLIASLPTVPFLRQLAPTAVPPVRDLVRA
ncbi:lycopene cyclase family protein [Frigoribacterium sp. UYMn621]|jgi:lycopene beta-cyclase|uniref:lycopene cyclase family protein n=1 Tax=Frigoribacterium sp. UYMn621 TaxID=3156343 RepID=UPI0033991F00